MNLEPRVDLHFDEEDGCYLLFLLNFKGTAKLRRKLQRRGVNVDRFTRTQGLLAKNVDKWIDSGLRPDGGEAPNERRLTSELHGELALQQFFHSVAIRFENDRPIVRPSLWGRSQPSKNQVAYIFTTLLACREWRVRLAKCRKCGIYFFLDKKILNRNRKQVWKHGCCCSAQHSARLTAQLSMKAKRDGRREQQFEWAAAELRRRRRERTDWYKDVSLKKELVRAVNRRLRFHEIPITVKWVTQNRTQIQGKTDSGNPESRGGRQHATR